MPLPKTGLSCAYLLSQMRKLLVHFSFIFCLIFFGLQSAFAGPACEAFFKERPISAQEAFKSNGRLKIHLAPGAVERLSDGFLRDLIQKLFPKNKISGEFEKQNFDKEVVLKDPRLVQLLESQFVKPLAKIFRSKELKELLDQFDPQIQIGKAQYRVVLKDLSLSSADDLAEKFGAQKDLSHGTIVNVQVQFESIDVQAAASHLDIVRAGVGRVGFSDMKVRATNPIALSIPIFLGVHKSGLPDFQVLGVDGFDPSQLSVQMKKMVLPKILLSIDGETIDLSPGNLDLNALQEDVLGALEMPGATEQITAHVVDFLNFSVAKIIRTKFTEKKGIQLDLDIETPFRKSVSLHVLPISLDADHASLAVGIDMDSKVAPKQRAQELGVCPIACSQYDVAVAVNRDLLQDLADQAFKMKVLSGISTAQGTISLTEAPQIEYAKPQADGENAAFVKLKLKLRPDHLPTGAGFIVKGDAAISVNVTAKISPDKSGKSVRVEVLKIGADQMAVEEGKLKGAMHFLSSLTPKFVKMGVQDLVLKVLSQKLKEKTMQFTLPDTLTELLGPLKIVGLHFDENQNLYLLLSDVTK